MRNRIPVLIVLILSVCFDVSGKSDAGAQKSNTSKASVKRDAPAQPEQVSREKKQDQAVDNPESLKGKKLSDVQKLKGKPFAKKKIDKGEKWFYHNFTITTTDGATVSKVEMEGGMLSLDKGAVAPVAPTKPAVPVINVPDIAVIANGGQQVDLGTVVVKGKITIVDFYADWCGPCKVVGPELEKMAASDPDVILRKIDIVNWETPVVKQHGIDSVPNVRVYGKDGTQIGAATPSPNAVSQYIAQAKK